MSEPNGNGPGTPSPSPSPSPSPTPTPPPTPEPPTPGQPAGAKGAEEHVPLTAEAIKVPDGLEVDESARTEFLTVANELRLSPEGAQRLVDLQAKLVQQASEKGSQAWDALVEKWTTESKADPVIGGDKLEPTLSSIAGMIDKYSVNAQGQPDPELAEKVREAFDLTRIGDHPAMIRWLGAIAKELAVEGGPVPAGQPQAGKPSPADLIYNG